MFIRYNRTKEERKALVAAVKEITGSEAVYLGAPSFAFEVGGVNIDRDGTLTFGGGTALEKARAIMAALAERGFAAVEADGLDDVGCENGTEPDDSDACAQNDDSVIDEAPPSAISIEFPLEGFTETALFNLERLVSSKAALIRKALGSDNLPMERLSDRLRFPWLPAYAPPVMVDACSKLVAALCDMAKAQRRVTAQERPVENERYAMRCFMLRLGFIGKEHCPARKALLANLSGDGSYKGGKPDK
jgi:hypothetical protein